MKIGVRAFPDVVEEVSELDVDYFEAAVRGSYAGDGNSIIPATDITVYKSIRDKIRGVHGSILYQGVNFMNMLRNQLNDNAIGNAIAAADEFSAEYIVFHPGYVEKGLHGENCSLENLCQIMRRYDDERLHLEVVPVFAYGERLVFPIHSVDDYKRLRDKTRKSIVLDLGHAMITARAMHYDPVDYMGRLIEELDIRIVHVADNDERGDGYEDSHMHIGEGSVPIEEILRKYKDRIEFATVEVNGVTPKDIGLVRHFVS